VPDVRDITVHMQHAFELFAQLPLADAPVQGKPQLRVVAKAPARARPARAARAAR